MHTAETAIFVPYFICIAWSIYNLVNLHQFKHKAFLEKRSTSLVHGFNIITILCMISTVLGTIAGLYLQSSDLGRYFSFLFLLTTTYLAFCFLNIKNWMIYYQYHWTYFTLQIKWQQIINDTDSEQNWFIENKSKYGNIRYVCKLFGIVHGIMIICSGVSLYFVMIYEDPSIDLPALIICAIITISLIIFYIIIVKKTPKWNDVFYIHWESKLHSKILLVGSIMLVLCTGSSTALSRLIPENNTGPKMGTCIVMMSQLLMWFGLNYVSTVKVTQKNINPYQQTIQNLAAIGDLDSNSMYDSKIITLDRVLTNEKCINLFMQHLSREYVYIICP